MATIITDTMTDAECDECGYSKTTPNEDGDICSCDKCECCDEEVGWDNIVVHDWGCVGLCETCSVKDGEPHCPRNKGCEWCQDEWEEMDDKWRKNVAKSRRGCDCDCCSDSRAGGTEPVPADCELYADFANDRCGHCDHE